MANQEHLARLWQGVPAWNAWRRENPDVSPDLSEIDIIGALLANVDFRGADLSRAKLPGAHLTGANLVRQISARRSSLT